MFFALCLVTPLIYAFWIAQHFCYAKASASPFSAVLNLYICQFCVSAFQFGVIVIRQVLLLPFALPIRNGKDKPYSYGACNLRVADCGCYAARCDGNTCRIVKCLNKITAVRCTSQILSAPLASGTTKHRKIHCLLPSPPPVVAVTIFIYRLIYKIQIVKSATYNLALTYSRGTVKIEFWLIYLSEFNSLSMNSKRYLRAYKPLRKESDII